MLATDATKLRWMGVDMRARWRRRVAVVLTYAAFAVVVWAPPPHAFDVIWLMVMAATIFPAVTLAEGLNVWSKRAVLGVLVAGWVWFSWKHPQAQSRMTIDIYSFLLVMGWTVLGWRGLVESVWMRNRWTRRLMGRLKRLTSLDDFAQHYFGESFAELTEEQQMEVGRLHRASPLGEWVRPGSGRFPRVEDERLRHEDDRLRAEVQRWMTWILWISAVGWSIAAMLHGSIRAETIEAWAWTVATLAVTLRQAIVLWLEEDPSEVSGEIRLAELEA